MWCGCCKQDVLAIPSHSDGEFRCARCLTGLVGATLERPNKSNPPTASFSPYDTWDFEAELAAGDNLVSQIRGKAPASGVSEPRRHVRIDGPHIKRVVRPIVASKPPSGLFAWMVIAAGLTGSVFGGALLVWSIWGGRGDLWPLGVPCTIGGQGILVLGLLLQLEAVWRHNRTTDQTIEQLRESVDSLRDEVGQQANPAAATWPHSFSSQFESGASPHVLLADLRGQLETLAARVAADRR